MIDLHEYLGNHKKQIIDSVEARPPRNVFEDLVNYLMNVLPIGRDGKAWRDKAHEELAIAIIQSVWCGWLSQAKANRGIYNQDSVDNFKLAINQAFEIGQNYARERP